jgi:mono/diheme cytochrome c family protein
MRSLRATLIPAVVTGLLWSAGTGGAATGSPAPVGAAPSLAPGTQGLPPGVTSDMVRQGRRLFAGAALCSSCHGPAGRGMAGLGSDLTDQRWQYCDGSYQGFISLVDKGISAERSGTGIPMPPKAGTNLTDEQVKAVAAYVWTLSHGGGG